MVGPVSPLHPRRFPFTLGTIAFFRTVTRCCASPAADHIDG